MLKRRDWLAFAGSALATASLPTENANGRCDRPDPDDFKPAIVATGLSA